MKKKGVKRHIRGKYNFNGEQGEQKAQMFRKELPLLYIEREEHKANKRQKELPCKFNRKNRFKGQEKSCYAYKRQINGEGKEERYIRGKKSFYVYKLEMQQK